MPMVVIWVNSMVLSKIARNELKNKILGITCHNSINFAKKAIKAKASYLAFGAFYSSKTKKLNIQQISRF